MTEAVPMADAIFGLLGVITGALVVGGSKRALARRRERGALRAALRLIADEYTDLAGTVQRLRMRERWPLSDWEDWRREASRDAQWEKHRDVLAARLGTADWKVIAGGREISRRVVAEIEAHARGQTERSMMADEIQRLSDWGQGLKMAADQAAVLAGVPVRT